MSKHPKPAERRETGQSQVRRFLLIFLGIVGAYYALTLVPWVDRNILYPVLQLSAQASSLLLNLTGESTTTKGIVIQGATFFGRGAARL